MRFPHLNRKRRRPSRFTKILSDQEQFVDSSSVRDNVPIPIAQTSQTDQTGQRRPKRKRFSAREDISLIPVGSFVTSKDNDLPSTDQQSNESQNPYALVLSSFTPKELQAMELRLRIQKVQSKLINPEAAYKQYLDERKKKYPDKSLTPSPLPEYDDKGRRTNTRIQVFTDKLLIQREELIREAMEINPAYKPPAGAKVRYFEKIVYIPTDKYPDYNFMGVLIGPRGIYQKKLEKETKCKISIRGKGVKTSFKVKKKTSAFDNMPLHVLIQATDKDTLEEAIPIVEKVLVPISDEQRTKQLRELAIMNGTFVEYKCRLCGLEGHKPADCPERQQRSWTAPSVQCAKCGSSQHVTEDCVTPDKDNLNLNLSEEYRNFLAEVSGGTGKSKDNTILRTTVSSSSSSSSSLMSSSPSKEISNSGKEAEVKLEIDGGVASKTNPSLILIMPKSMKKKQQQQQQQQQQNQASQNGFNNSIIPQHGSTRQGYPPNKPPPPPTPPPTFNSHLSTSSAPMMRMQNTMHGVQMQHPHIYPPCHPPQRMLTSLPPHPPTTGYPYRPIVQLPYPFAPPTMHASGRSHPFHPQHPRPPFPPHNIQFTPR